MAIENDLTINRSAIPTAEEVLKENLGVVQVFSRKQSTHTLWVDGGGEFHTRRTLENVGNPWQLLVWMCKTLHQKCWGYGTPLGNATRITIEVQKLFKKLPKLVDLGSDPFVALERFKELETELEKLEKLCTDKERIGGSDEQIREIKETYAFANSQLNKFKYNWFIQLSPSEVAKEDPKKVVDLLFDLVQFGSLDEDAFAHIASHLCALEKVHPGKEIDKIKQCEELCCKGDLLQGAIQFGVVPQLCREDAGFLFNLLKASLHTSNFETVLKLLLNAEGGPEMIAHLPFLKNPKEHLRDLHVFDQKLELFALKNDGNAEAVHELRFHIAGLFNALPNDKLKRADVAVVAERAMAEKNLELLTELLSNPKLPEGMEIQMTDVIKEISVIRVQENLLAWFHTEFEKIAHKGPHAIQAQVFKLINELQRSDNEDKKSEITRKLVLYKEGIAGHDELMFLDTIIDEVVTSSEPWKSNEQLNAFYEEIIKELAGG